MGVSFPAISRVFLRNHLSRWGSSVLFTLAFGALGCSGSDPPPSHGGSPLPTGSTCPDQSTPSLTYGGWAQYFFASYCTRCHSSMLETPTERNGATPHANWDDLPTIRAYATEIDAFAAGGPDGINRVMPPSDPKPSDEERKMLGEWLACGAPE